MTLAELKKAVSELSPEEQTELTAWLVKLRNRHDPELLRELDRICDDRDPAHWMSLEDVEVRVRQLETRDSAAPGVMP